MNLNTLTQRIKTWNSMFGQKSIIAVVGVLGLLVAACTSSYQRDRFNRDYVARQAASYNLIGPQKMGVVLLVNDPSATSRPIAGGGVPGERRNTGGGVPGERRSTFDQGLTGSQFLDPIGGSSGRLEVIGISDTAGQFLLAQQGLISPTASSWGQRLPLAGLSRKPDESSQVVLSEFRQTQGVPFQSAAWTTAPAADTVYMTPIYSNGATNPSVPFKLNPGSRPTEISTGTMSSYNIQATATANQDGTVSLITSDITDYRLINHKLHSSFRLGNARARAIQVHKDYLYVATTNGFGQGTTGEIRVCYLPVMLGLEAESPEAARARANFGSRGCPPGDPEYLNKGIFSASPLFRATGTQRLPAIGIPRKIGISDQLFFGLEAFGPILVPPPTINFDHKIASELHADVFPVNLGRKGAIHGNIIGQLNLTDIAVDPGSYFVLTTDAAQGGRLITWDLDTPFTLGTGQIQHLGGIPRSVSIAQDTGRVGLVVQENGFMGFRVGVGGASVHPHNVVPFPPGMVGVDGAMSNVTMSPQTQDSVDKTSSDEQDS